MSRERHERLAAMRRELEKQNEEWRLIKAALAQLGDGEIAVPTRLLEKLERHAVIASPNVNINAVRG